jgi:predicted nucleotidyltransferase
MASALDLQMAQQFAAELYRELGDNLLRVSLFGSRARRDHRPRSDFDFMIVLGQATGDARSTIHNRALTWELDRRVSFSTKILSNADFQRLRVSPESFWRNFARDERRLWPTN